MTPRTSAAPTTTALPLTPPLAPLGIGTVLGDPTDAEDARYAAAIAAALDRGVRLVDTAINYRCQRSERVVGRVIESWSGDHDAVTVITKGGYVPLDTHPPADKTAYREYITREYVEPGIIRDGELVAGGHCITARFIEDQIERSTRNLCGRRIDAYLLHNPEQQLDGCDRETLEQRLRDTFALLESHVARGRIGSYGVATWHGARVTPETHNHLSLESLVHLAREVAGGAHAFRTVQIPVNLAMLEAARVPTQQVGSHRRTALEAADELGLTTIAVAPLMQGRLATALPRQIRDALPEGPSDAARAVSFVRSLPYIASVVVGTRDVGHVREMLKG